MFVRDCGRSLVSYVTEWKPLVSLKQDPLFCVCVLRETRRNDGNLKKQSAGNKIQIFPQMNLKEPIWVY